jgi:hypothetical protein
LAAALPRLARHVRDIMMLSAGLTRAGVFLNLILLLILVNPLLAKTPKGKEKGRQQQQEERQTEFVKGKSKEENFSPSTDKSIIKMFCCFHVEIYEINC